MKTEIREIKTYEFWVRFTPSEVTTIRECMAYCRHRIIKHPTSGINKAPVKLEHIQDILTFFPLEASKTSEDATK